MALRFDHLVVSAEHLETGVQAVEALLGVSFEAGGKHPRYGTHNALLGLGEGLYLEVIAIDPQATPEAMPRWFGLDTFRGAPRLTNWVCRAQGVHALLPELPPGFAGVVGLSRGALAWEMAEAEGGELPFDQCFPGLIDWKDSAHPTTRLHDCGVVLERLDLIHPDAEGLSAALDKHFSDARVSVAEGAMPMLKATLRTPSGALVKL